jgi:hypothetical protein
MEEFAAADHPTSADVDAVRSGRASIPRAVAELQAQQLSADRS